MSTAHPERPSLDMALTGALLDAVARGEAPETVRVLRPGPTLAFGRRDRTRPGFADARRVALAHGREAVIRYGGGHAAAYDPDCVLVEVIRRHEQLLGDLDERFLDMVTLVREALTPLGVALELGELPGEYCPGRFSLHLPSGPKVAGVAQRVIPRASLTSAVVVIRGGDALRDTLDDVYRALALPLDIRTAGAVADRHPEIAVELVAEALFEAAAARYRAVPAQIGPDTVRRANELIVLDSV